MRAVGSQMDDGSARRGLLALPMPAAVESDWICRHAKGKLKLPFSLFLALRYLKPKHVIGNEFVVIVLFAF